MFYLHLLALPMFIFLRKDLISQLNAINAGPSFTFTIPLPAQTNPSFLPFDWNRFSFLSHSQIIIHIPSTYLSLLINTLTQLLCVAGVHRLTTRVSALTVTLVLVVRKAASLVLSVVGVSVLPGWGGRAHREKRAQEVDIQMTCVGATMVLLGTIGYASAHGKGKDNSKDKKE
jgi:UDP-xylose/UDP-N-acetylglucosamine transporter B4